MRSEVSLGLKQSRFTISCLKEKGAWSTERWLRHILCVTLSGNPFANKQLICFSFKKYKSTIYCYIYYFTLMSFIYLVYHTVKNLYIISMSKGSLVSEFCSLGETDILSCRFVANYMIFIQLTLVS